MKIHYIQNFKKSRAEKLGASDIPALIQHPETAESLAGYDRTAVTVYKEKSGLLVSADNDTDSPSDKADIGSDQEPIALKRFLTQTESPELAQLFYRGYLLCELDFDGSGYPSAEATQNTNYLHHTRAEIDFAIAHADCFRVYDQNENIYPAIVEAKARGFWPSQRKDDPYKGYDFETTGHKGIPLADYYQLQFQAAIYQEVYKIQIDNLFLALLYDTNSFNFWQVKSDRRVQERLLELAHYMKKCIGKKQPPKMLVMNQKDVKELYPKLNEDFITLSGDELENAIEASKQAGNAKKQKKAWEQKERDALDALSVYLKDNKKIKGIIDGEIIEIAEWQERKGAERIAGIKEIRQDETLYTALQEKGFVRVGEDSKYVKVKFKEGKK